MSDSAQKRLATALGAWYREHSRALPWRTTKDPYRIWVSEIMAQQTRIGALIPYYERFIERFPDVQALSGAEEDEVLACWAGLGYYRRARHMHRAAQRITGEMQGRFPDDYATIKSLPGIGEYTAGAIASIAFGHATPAVDGNVKRVYARLYLDGRALQDRFLKRDVREWVSGLMPHEEPSVLTQSLMELGALVCSPRTPSCGTCPVRTFCAAYKEEKQDLYPTPSAPRTRRSKRLSVLIIEDDEGNRMMGRRTGTLLSGLYEYPNLVGFVAKTRIQEVLADWGVDIEEIRFAGHKEHAFTHLLWRMRFYHCHSRTSLQDASHDGYRAFSEQARNELGIPKAFELPALPHDKT